MPFHRQVRALANPMLFNNLGITFAAATHPASTSATGFANSCIFRQSSQEVASAVNRPANRPGAD
jgi:hypothetical protein